MSNKASADAATPLTGEWQNVRTIVASAFDRAVYFYFVDPANRPKHVMELMRIASLMREYTLTSRDLIDIWSQLRQDQLNLDVLMDVTGELALLSPLDIPTLAKQFAKAVHAAIPREFKDNRWISASHNATDPAFLESVAEERQLADALTSNPWALTLLIMKQAGIFTYTGK
jgi:hypothetical protein